MAHRNIGLNELREMFLKFFETKDHLRLPSFSLIPQNDPSLLLINSGMAPMKPYFTGEVEPPRRRVCTCQKCIRTGDIENIGKTARHGTYFEMLGNFSFGDYFKSESLAWSWEFLTSPEWVGLEPDRLYPSIYLDDDEAFDVWTKEIGVPADHIVRMGKADNFWEHGSGPCGPCSEIYYDRGIENGCGKPDCKPGCDCDRFMEVWNNVFSQFNNDGEGNYTDLAQKNIDTGMGLERLACVSQNVASLFDVDTVMNITNRVSEITGAHYKESYKKDVSLRIITDHIRSATFMICDGVQPSNEGRGYVLRRLLRRAARHGKLLGVNEPFLYDVVETVIHENEGHYPELRQKADYITRVIKTEEENFARTIDAGMRIFGEILEQHKANGEKIFSGADAFKLYDTYGFPIDLTAEMVEEQGMDINMEEFTTLMNEQRQRARAARGDMSDAWAGLDLGLDSTPTQFVGYNYDKCSAKVLALVEGGETCGVLGEGRKGIVVLDCTTMYAEMGGQVADHGRIICGDAVFAVSDVQKDKSGKYLHHGEMISGSLNVGDEVRADIDTERRRAIMRAHSATHLLQRALKDVLGDHVHQAGSLVEPDHLRFDFTHFSSLTTDEILAINKRVGNMVLDGLDISICEMPIDEARKMGATALFGEKYGDIVRVVSMGEESVELCGGTHLSNTAMVGPFHIVSEGSVASGVRRIEALTGKAFMQRVDSVNRTISEAAAVLKTQPSELVSRLESNLNEMREMRQSIEKLKDKILAGDVERFLFAAKKVCGLNVITTTRPDLEVADIRKMGDFLRDKDSKIVAVIASFKESKVSLAAFCGKEAVAAGIKAGDIIKTIAPVVGGKGGGKPDSAMGGGSDVIKIDDALAMVDNFVASKLG
ncbi:MAG: alanine--tRNA ligase [Ruminococcaceae bacterium]|nr:alanine--tRNA ligase [Oscillospiraceae bacterium]